LEVQGRVWDKKPKFEINWGINLRKNQIRSWLGQNCTILETKKEFAIND